MVLVDSRPSLFAEHPNAGADPHVFEHRHLRIRCFPLDPKVPSCGETSMLIMAHEPANARMTGSTLYLVRRCGYCGAVQSASSPTIESEYSRWPRP